MPNRLLGPKNPSLHTIHGIGPLALFLAVLAHSWWVVQPPNLSQSISRPPKPRNPYHSRFQGLTFVYLLSIALSTSVIYRGPRFPWLEYKQGKTQPGIEPGPLISQESNLDLILARNRTCISYTCNSASYIELGPLISQESNLDLILARNRTWTSYTCNSASYIELGPLISQESNLASY